MRTFIRFAFLLGTLLSSSSSFSFVSPWGGGVASNPFGFPGNRFVSPPPFYNPGPGNPAPSFSYTQQPFSNQSLSPNSQQVVHSGLTKEAKNVIGKWTLRADENRTTPEKITDIPTQITRDRRVLDDAQKMTGLTPDDLNSIGQIKVLLNLAEIRALITPVEDGTKGFPALYSSVVGYTDKSKDDQDSNDALTKDWYTSKRDRLDFLLRDFQQFLSRNPAYVQNPPDLLVGLSTTLNEGVESLNRYRQFCNCIESPNLSYCKTLVQTASKDDGADDNSENDYSSSRYRSRR